MSWNKTPDAFIDVTDQVCPMTFVRTRLALDRLQAGSVLEVRLNAGEALESVPRSASELGHRILGAREDPEAPGVHRLRIERA